MKENYTMYIIEGETQVNNLNSELEHHCHSMTVEKDGRF